MVEMEYIIVKRVRLSGDSEDLLSIQKTAKTLKEALKYTTALEMLEEDSSGRVSYEIKIDIKDAFKYLNLSDDGLTKSNESTSEFNIAKRNSVVNIK